MFKYCLFVAAFVVGLICAVTTADANGGRVVQRQRIVQRQPIIQRRQRIVVQQQLVAQPYYAQEVVQQQIVQKVIAQPVYSQRIIAQPVVQQYAAPQALVQPQQLSSPGCQAFFAH